jgi:hypothetical protein
MRLAWEAVEQFRQGRTDLPADELETYLQNYLRKVFRTGKSEYDKEHRPWGPANWQLCDLPAPEDRPLLQETLDHLERHLREEPLHRRVPFRLRHCRALGPLDGEELAWLADQAGIPVEALTERIREEFDAHSDQQYPLGAKFIAGLLDISVALVDQRVRQVLLGLRRRLVEGEQS